MGNKFQSAESSVFSLIFMRLNLYLINLKEYFSWCFCHVITGYWNAATLVKFNI